MPFTFYWNSLKARITLLTLGIALLSFLLMLLLSGQLIRRDVKELLATQQLSMASLVASDLDEALALRLKLLGDLAEKISAIPLGDGVAIQTMLEQHPVLQNLFNNGVFVVDASGRINAYLPLNPQRIGLRVADRDYFKSVMATGKPLISAPMLGKSSQHPVVVMAAGIRNAQGQVVGLLAGSIDLALPNFLDRITGDRFGKSGQTFVVAPQNRTIVATSDKSRIMEVLPAPGVNPWIDRFMQGYEGSAVVVNPHGLEVLVTVKQVPIAGWYTSVILSTEEAFAPVDRLRGVMALVVPLVMALAAALIGWALRRQLRPLMDTTATLTQLALSDQPLQPLPISRQDEVGALVGGFNHLLQVLSQRQQALQESEGRFRALADNASALVWMTDAQAQTSYFNQIWLDFTGRSMAQEMGRGWTQGVHPDDLQRASQAFFSAFEARQGFSLDCRLRRADGIYRWLTFHGVPRHDDQGGFLGYIGTGIDITERKLSEERLQLLASVFTHADEGILISAADGAILDANAAFSRISGYTLAEVQGQNPHLLSSGKHDQAFYASMWTSLQAHGQWRGEIWNRRKNGDLYAAMLTISAVRDAQGQVGHYVALSTDITPLKEHAKQLENSAHFDALTQLPNRLLLSDRLQHALLHAQRVQQRLAVVFLDLDGFKGVNDQHGHEVGDQLLVTLAQRMQQALREVDTLARLGGDEFLAVLQNVADLSACEPILQRLLAAAAQPVDLGECVVQVSASMGLTFYPQEQDIDGDQLLRQADMAMYQAKLAGKNRYQLFEPGPAWGQTAIYNLKNP